MNLASSCRTIYSLAWRRPAGLTRTTGQDCRWISMQSLLPSSATCNWSMSNRETTEAHNRKVLEGKLTICVFFWKFVENPKQKVFFRGDEQNWRWCVGHFLILTFFICTCLADPTFLKEMHKTLQVPSLHLLLAHVFFLYIVLFSLKGKTLLNVLQRPYYVTFPSSKMSGYSYIMV